MAELGGDAMAQQQVAHQRFATDQEFVRQDEPRPRAQSSGADEALQRVSLLRTDLQVILQQARLTVQVEVDEGWIPFQEIQQLVHQSNQADAEVLKGHIPLPIPVRVGDDVNRVGRGGGIIWHQGDSFRGYLAKGATHLGSASHPGSDLPLIDHGKRAGRRRAPR